MALSHDLLRLKLAESLSAPLPELTRRDVHLPGIRGKAFAVIGVRRGGKTSFLRQCMIDRMASGRPREAQLLLSLEDERLPVGQSAGGYDPELARHQVRSPHRPCRRPSRTDSRLGARCPPPRRPDVVTRE